jgi:hypothetical protein
VTQARTRVQRRRAERRRERRVAGHGGSVARTAEEAVLRLQSLAGNRATSRALVAAAPVPFTPSGPMSGNELGHTRVRGREPPKFVVDRDGVVASATKGSVDIEAEYIAAGTYDMEPNKYGPRKKLITPQMSELVKQGEQEHADDIWWGHELVYSEVARAINVLAAHEPYKGANGIESRRLARAALHDVISPKLRITAEASEPPSGDSVTQPWTDAVSTLYQRTLARDSAPNHWHTMKLRSPTPDELKANPMPQGTTLMVVDKGGEIGQHKSEAYIRAGWDALKDRP